MLGITFDTVPGGVLIDCGANIGEISRNKPDVA